MKLMEQITQAYDSMDPKPTKLKCGFKAYNTVIEIVHGGDIVTYNADNKPIVAWRENTVTLEWDGSEGHKWELV